MKACFPDSGVVTQAASKASKTNMGAMIFIFITQIIWPIDLLLQR